LLGARTTAILFPSQSFHLPRQRFGNHLVLQFVRGMTGQEKVTKQHVEKFLDELGPLVPLV